MKVGAPEFAVGDAAQSQLLLEFDDAADRVVLDGAKLVRVDRAHAELFPRIEQEFRPQETADMVGAKRRQIARAGCHLTGGWIHTRILTAVELRARFTRACVSPTVFLHRDGRSAPWKAVS